MKFTPEVIAALTVLRENAENDFERHRLDVLERDLNAPPAFEKIDETHQRFNGITFVKSKDGHYKSSRHIHRDVWQYHYGEIPEGCEIHHVDENPTNNAIDNLQCLNKSEHRKVHTLAPKTERVCPTCGKSFVLEKPTHKKTYCSHECYIKYRFKTYPIERICPICGKKFSVSCHNPKQIYCSHACVLKKINDKKSPIEKTCPVCGKTFIPPKSKQIYCSNACKVKRRKYLARRNYIKKTCLFCKKEFQAKNKAQVFCSRSCQQKAGYQRRKLKQQKNITVSLN